MVNAKAAKTVELSEQITMLAKSGEGKEETTILSNKMPCITSLDYSPRKPNGLQNCSNVKATDAESFKVTEYVTVKDNKNFKLKSTDGKKLCISDVGSEKFKVKDTECENIDVKVTSDTTQYSKVNDSGDYSAGNIKSTRDSSSVQPVTKNTDTSHRIVESVVETSQEKRTSSTSIGQSSKGIIDLPELQNKVSLNRSNLNLKQLKKDVYKQLVYFQTDAHLNSKICKIPTFYFDPQC